MACACLVRAHDARSFPIRTTDPIGPASRAGPPPGPHGFSYPEISVPWRCSENVLTALRRQGSKPKASRSATVCVYIADNDKQQQRPAHSQVPAMKSLDTVAGLFLQRNCHSRACGMQRMLASTASSEMLARVHDVRWHGQSKTWKHTRMIL